MSGFAILFEPRSEQVDISALDSMFERVRHRGPDAQASWAEGPVGMAAAVFRVTPEARAETQPFVDAHGVVVVFDGRLDDLDDLRRRLGLDPAMRSAPELVAHAYARFGARFAGHLLGDFTVAVFDPRRRRLLLARDPMGVRPVYFTRTRDAFLAASEVKALLAHPAVSAGPDMDLLAEYLLHGSARATHWDTFFVGVKAVPPGVTVSVDERGVVWHTHAEIDLASSIRFRRYEDYVDAFKERFEIAVARRLRSATPVLVRVSGGLDSSAVFCTALRLRNEGKIATDVVGASWTFPAGSPADEVAFLSPMEDMYDVSIERVSVDHTGLADSALAQTHTTETPYAGLGWNGLARMAAVGAQRGCRVQLSGLWGDQLLMDHAYRVDLARGLRLPTLVRHLRGAARWRLEDLSPTWVYRALFSDVVRWTVPPVLHGPLRRARARKNAQHAADWYSDELRRRAALPPTRPPIAGWSRTSVHARDLATNVGSVYQVIGMASNALNAGFHGHENWMPMLDRELVQFVASIPGEIVTPDGRSRGLLRDAMVGTLPEEIRLRRSKADGTHVLSSALLEQLPAIEEFLSRESIAASVGLVRPGSRAGDLERAASAARASSDFSEARDMLHLVGLEAWSRSFFTPVDRMTDR